MTDRRVRTRAPGDRAAPRRPRGDGSRTGARGAPRRNAYHHGNLRRALIDAALGLVEREGPEGLTLREAARRAGVSQAAPYRHFADKEALLAAVAEEGFRAMTQAMRDAAPPSDEPLARFRALGLAYVAFAVSRPSHFRVMFGRIVADRSHHPSLRDAASEAFSLLVDAIAECQRAGHVRTGDPRELAIAAWSAVHGLGALAVDGQLADITDQPLDVLADTVTRDLFLGLGMQGA